MALPRRRADHKQDARSGDQPDWHASYEIENAADVDAYVDRHRFLRPLLLEAPARIAESFGPHDGLALEAPIDPEDSSRHLYLRIRTAAPFESVQRARDRLDDEWWIGAMREARGRMTVDVEYR
jgi:hypothetical protein